MSSLHQQRDQVLVLRVHHSSPERTNHTALQRDRQVLAVVGHLQSSASPLDASKSSRLLKSCFYGSDAVDLEQLIIDQIKVDLHYELIAGYVTDLQMY